MRAVPLFVAMCVGGIPAQQNAPKSEPLHWFSPADYDRSQWVPFVVLWGTREQAKVLDDGWFAGVVVDEACDGKSLQAVMTEARQRFGIELGGAHAVIGGHARTALEAVRNTRHEFHSVTTFGAARDANLDAVRRLRTRRVGAVTSDDMAEVHAHVRALHQARRLSGAAGAGSQALDSFNDAAAVGDEDRYFAILPDDSVFLGTDASERWDGKQFREFAMPYFKRPSAWTYVPLERHVTLSDDGKFAWFDEALDNAHYGECRGTGVMQLRDGAWVLRQYNLTVPVPNDLMADVASRIRSFSDGVSPAVTRIVFAPMRDGGGKSVEDALRDVRIAKRYSGDKVPSVRAIRRAHPGETVLVATAVDKVSEMMSSVGVATPPLAGTQQRLYVVTFGIGGARMLPLQLPD